MRTCKKANRLQLIIKKDNPHKKWLLVRRSVHRTIHPSGREAFAHELCSTAPLGTHYRGRSQVLKGIFIGAADLRNASALWLRSMTLRVSLSIGGGSRSSQ